MLVLHHHTYILLPNQTLTSISCLDEEFNPGDLSSSKDDEFENDQVLDQFVSDTIKRAHDLAAENPKYTFTTIMKALKVRSPVAIARATKRKINPWNEAQRAMKLSRPAHMAGQSMDPKSKLMVPHQDFVPWVKEAYADEATRTNFVRIAAKKETLANEKPKVDQILKLQRSGIKALVKQATRLRDLGVHSILLAVGDKDPNSVLFTSKGYGLQYYTLIAQGGKPRNISEFYMLVYGANVMVEAVEVEKNERAAATRADGSMLLIDIRKKVRSLILERISKY